ncbi:hypothetical protein A0H81_03960 [Grifola frondosa]|uniref:Uncharacterized protein n=1 Tax=Grifola frondosa TaxID=5627 RepID=A0A1C7MHU2_GRIFR|nr:hypothetical protein A0H81_03960 [Grifola frondosa]
MNASTRLPLAVVAWIITRNNPFGLQGHALLLSLPPVLLVWSIIAFTASVTAYTLQNVTGNRITNAASTWTIIALFVVVFISAALGIYTFAVIWRWQSKNL